MNPFFNNPLFFGVGPTPPALPSDSSSSDEEERVARLATIFAVAQQAIEEEVRDTASSSRCSTKRDARALTHDRLVRDYFNEEPKFDAAFFRTRFRMRKELFLKIVGDMESNFEYFKRKFDSRGRIGFSSLQKCTSAIRQLAYGTNPDSLDEYLNMSERVSRDSLNFFCDGIIKLYRREFLRRPTYNDVRILFNHHSHYHGFPGMLGIYTLLVLNLYMYVFYSDLYTEFSYTYILVFISVLYMQ